MHKKQSFICMKWKKNWINKKKSPCCVLYMLVPPNKSISATRGSYFFSIQHTVKNPLPTKNSPYKILSLHYHRWCITIKTVSWKSNNEHSFNVYSFLLFLTIWHIGVALRRLTVFMGIYPKRKWNRILLKRYASDSFKATR